MRGASALDRLLADFPDADLSVQVVWEPVLRTDVAPPLSRVIGSLSDRRVVQFWDPGLVLSADIVRSVNESPSRYGLEGPLPPDSIAWDVVAVFATTARWERDLPPPVHYDGPVVSAIEGARKAIAEALAASREPSRPTPR